MEELKKRLLKPAVPIADPEFEAFIKEVSALGAELLKFTASSKATPLFLNNWREWLLKSENNQLLGLEAFSILELSAGTTQAFDDFHFCHSDKRLRVLRGEYPYHKDLFTPLKKDWLWVEEAPLESGDYLILSAPFSGSGHVHPQTWDLLKTCNEKQIPVLIDCAFWGLAQGILLDLRPYNCIQKVCFSLSKVFNVGRFRIGLVCSKEKGGAVSLQNNWDYTHKLGAFYGSKLIENFSCGYLYKKHRQNQLEFCHELQLQPSDTVLFGLGDSSWQDYSRDGSYNRVCLSKLLSRRALGRI